MDLYLVRHAIAEPHDSVRWPDDSERPLTAAGIERFRSAASGLRRLGVEVDAVLASPYVRTWHTAELLTKQAMWPSPERCSALEPSTPESEYLAALRDRQESALALVGHQPLLSELASLLLAGDGRLLRLELKKAPPCAFASTAVPRQGTPPCAGA